MKEINRQYTIYNLCVRALKTGRKVILWRVISGLFCSECKSILYLPTMYVYCVYPAMSKCSKTTTNVSEKSRNMRRSGRFNGVLYNVRADTVTVSGNIKVIFLSVTVYCKSYLVNAI